MVRMSDNGHGRRTFLQVAAAGAALLTKAVRAGADENTPPKDPKEAGKGPTAPEPPAAGEVKLAKGSKVGRRKLGSTGVEVSMVGLGGFHLGLPSEAEAIRIVHTALDHGIDFLDNCWDYNDGKSEERLGKALAHGKRKHAFVMTKLDGRTAESARGQLEQSMKRLKTDMIDLVQIHEVIRPTDPDRCFADGGCIEALLEARKAGKLRFIGFTGHKDPSIHLAMLDRAAKAGFNFDTVQMPLNALDAHFRSFGQLVLPRLVQEKIGVLGMKSLGAGEILKARVAEARELLRYSLSLPTSVVITGCDSIGVVEQAIDVALKFKPMSDEETKELLARTATVAATGKYEAFKTTQTFDGTEQHKHWLEEARL